jgi:putative flippase GtrA
VKRAARIGLLYAGFAAVAILANLGSQMLAVWLYRGAFAIELSIAVGTAVGLLIKYLLDKRHIFGFKTESVAHDGRLFILYSLMGVFTTLLFWGVEYAFHWLFGTDAMRYLGGAIGLILGYVIKYRLDKRFVFVARAPAGTA